MKKIVLLITVFCFLVFQVINAQTDKGRIMVGISSTASLNTKGSDIMGLGFSKTKYVSSTGTSSDAYKTSSINLIPKVGYFVINNLAAGLDITIGSSTTKYNVYSGSSKTKASVLCIGPFARYYVALLDKFKPFAELNVGIGGTKTKNESSGSGSGSSSEHKSGIFLVGFWAGMAMPLGDRVTFDAMLGYNNVTYKTKVTGIQSKSLNLAESTKEKIGTFGVKMGFVVFLDMKNLD